MLSNVKKRHTHTLIKILSFISEMNVLCPPSKVTQNHFNQNLRFNWNHVYLLFVCGDWNLCVVTTSTTHLKGIVRNYFPLLWSDPNRLVIAYLSRY